MKPIEMVVVGFDGSDESRWALSWAASLCAALDASLEVVHAVGLLEEAHLASAVILSEVDIQALAGEAGLRPGQVRWRLVEGAPADVLLRLTAEPSEIDLLVVGSRGAAGRAGTVLGSTSLEVTEAATVPVAVIHRQP